MATKITATELARDLSDVLNRVRYRGESFAVEQNGEVVAEISPAHDTPTEFTVADFRREFADVHVPEGLGADIEDARKALGSLPEPPWDS